MDISNDLPGGEGGIRPGDLAPIKGFGLIETARTRHIR
jgi:hypothetical protein